MFPVHSHLILARLTQRNDFTFLIKGFLGVYEISEYPKSLSNYYIYLHVVSCAFVVGARHTMSSLTVSGRVSDIDPILWVHPSQMYCPRNLTLSSFP